MQNDVLIDFYLASVKVQSHEFHLCNSKLPAEYSTSLARETENVRRELGSALTMLLNSALPSRVRQSRMFRAKYTEEVDIRNLENCLIAAANKVVSFNPANAPRDYDLRPAQPSAIAFLDSVSQVQCIVANLIEISLVPVDPDHLTDSTAPSEELDLRRDSPTSEQGETELNSSNTTSLPAVLRERGAASSQGLVKSNTTPNTTHTTNRLIEVQLTIGPSTFHEQIQVPAASNLCISEELCSRLMELDTAASQFEYEFVRSLSRRLRTPREANDLQLVTVLFSETLMWGLAVRLFTMQQLSDRDPVVFLTLPRLAILVGIRLLPDSPIGSNRLVEGRHIPTMFTGCRLHLAFLARQLHALRADQLCRLARWLGPRGLPNLIHQKPTAAAATTIVSSSPRVGTPPTASPAHPTASPTQRTPLANSLLTSNHRSPSGHILSASWSGSNPLTTASGGGGGDINTATTTAAQGGRVWRKNVFGLHQIFKRISQVADEMSTKFPTELRFALQSCVEMHDNSSAEEAIAAMESPASAMAADLSRISAQDSSDGESSNEAEVEWDPVRTGCDGSKYYYASLQQLLDWPGVMMREKAVPNRGSSTDSVTRNGPACLTLRDALKQPIYFSADNPVGTPPSGSLQKSTGDNSRWVLSDPSSFDAQTESSRTKSVAGSVELELGLDVAASLDRSARRGHESMLDEENVGTLGLIRGDTCVVPTGSRFARLPTTDASSEDTEASFNQRLNKLNLGVSVEGKPAGIDTLWLHYLPAWQPDRVRRSPSTSSRLSIHSTGSSSASDDSGDSADSDGERGRESRRHRVFIVGRQCATCLRLFTLFRRRHHCRRCGHIFCGSCCSHWQSVEGLASTKPVRICVECHRFLHPIST